MNRMIMFLTVFLAILFTQVTIAKIYKWTDEKGKVHFTDTPPNKENAEELNEEELAKRIVSYKQVEVKFVPIDFGVNQQTNMLVMYTTTRCRYCAKARKYFAEQSISYVEKNIDLSLGYHREFRRLGGKGVPLILSRKYQMSGFNQSRFDKMYAKSGF